MPCPEPWGAMTRRNKTGGKAPKAQRLKTLRRRIGPRSARSRGHHATGNEPNVEQLTRDLADAREREAATAQVLKVISSSPGELGPVFRAILENAV